MRARVKDNKWFHFCYHGKQPTCIKWYYEIISKINLLISFQLIFGKYFWYSYQYEWLINTPFTNSIMWIFSALFGRKIGTGAEWSTLFYAGIIRIIVISALGADFGICEPNSKIMWIISKVQSNVTFNPVSHLSFQVFVSNGGSLKSVDYFLEFKVCERNFYWIIRISLMRIIGGCFCERGIRSWHMAYWIRAQTAYWSFTVRIPAWQKRS